MARPDDVPVSAPAQRREWRQNAMSAGRRLAAATGLRGPDDGAVFELADDIVGR